MIVCRILSDNSKACMSMSVAAALEGHHVLYIDSGASCSLERLLQIFQQRMGSEEISWLERIHIKRVSDLHGLLEVLADVNEAQGIAVPGACSLLNITPK